MSCRTVDLRRARIETDEKFQTHLNLTVSVISISSFKQSKERQSKVMLPERDVLICRLLSRVN